MSQFKFDLTGTILGKSGSNILVRGGWMDMGGAHSDYNASLSSNLT